VTVFSPANEPGPIAIDPSYAYFGDNSAVRRVSLDGGSEIRLARGYANRIAVDSTNVYFTLGGSPSKLESVPIDGGSVTTLAKPAGDVLAIDVTSAYLDSTDCPKDGGPCDAVLLKVPLGGGKASTIASGGDVHVTGIAVDTTDVYWTTSPTVLDEGTLTRAPLTGGPTATLASGQPRPGAVAVDSKYAFWATYSAVFQIPLGGGSITTLAGGTPQEVAVDSNMVYWTNGYAGTVVGVPLGGGAVTTLASGQSNPTGIAVDATYVYWTNSAMPGAVMKVAKP
jgi:hypothetical protein